MHRSIAEDLQQLQALGWKWHRWLRKEQNYLRHRRPLRDVHEARREPLPFSDLVWVLEGDRLSRGLTADERYLLVALAGEKSPVRMARWCGLSRGGLGRALHQIMHRLYNRTGREHE